MTVVLKWVWGGGEIFIYIFNFFQFHIKLWYFTYCILLKALWMPVKTNVSKYSTVCYNKNIYLKFKWDMCYSNVQSSIKHSFQEEWFYSSFHQPMHKCNFQKICCKFIFEYHAFEVYAFFYDRNYKNYCSQNCFFYLITSEAWMLLTENTPIEFCIVTGNLILPELDTFVILGWLIFFSLG